MKQARTQIARAARVRVEELPIVISVGHGEIRAGIMAPRNAPEGTILERTSGICEAIAASWRNSCRVDNDAEHTVQDNSEKALAQAPPVKDSTSASTGSIHPAPLARSGMRLESLERRMSQGLDKLRASGDVDITFMVGGHSSTIHPIKLKARPMKAAQNACLSDRTHILPISVHKLVTSTVYSVRVTGESAMCLASFTSSGKIGAILKLLAGWPSVWARVRPYQASSDMEAPRNAFRIEEILALTDEWNMVDGISSPIADIRDCLTSLERLPVCAEPPLAHDGSTP